jgi:hypothetical protein
MRGAHAPRSGFLPHLWHRPAARLPELWVSGCGIGPLLLSLRSGTRAPVSGRPHPSLRRPGIGVQRARTVTGSIGRAVAWRRSPCLF